MLTRGRHVCPRDSWSKQDESSTLKRLGTNGIAPIRFFFPLPPFVWDSKTKMKRGWGYCVSTERRGRLGGIFVQGIHSTSSSINPLLCCFFLRGRHRVTAALYGGKQQRREGLWRSAEHQLALRPLGGTFTDRMMCNCVGLHDGLTREHCTWVNNCQLAPCQLGLLHPGHVIS